jgi:hypothetical protein
MTRPTLSTVQAAHNKHAVGRAIALLGLVAAAILLAGLARTAPSPERGVVIPDSISSIPSALDNGQGEPIAAPGEFTQLRSGVHGYRISYPSAWHVQRATENTESDVIYDGLLIRSRFKSKLTISRRELPAGMTIADVAKPWFPLAPLKRGECGTRQPFYGKMLRAATFEEATIAGRSALIRSECSVVDAIVDLDHEALLLRLESRRSMTTGDDRLFARLTERLQIDPGQSGIREPR